MLIHTYKRKNNEKSADINFYNYKSSKIQEKETNISKFEKEPYDIYIFSTDVPKNINKEKTEIYFDEKTCVLTFLYSINNSDFIVKTRKDVDFREPPFNAKRLSLKDIHFSDENNMLNIAFKVFE